MLEGEEDHRTVQLTMLPYLSWSENMLASDTFKLTPVAS